MKASERTPRSPEKIRPIAAKRISKKKSKDKPKRPLSAYNYFFREEREKILRVLRSNNESTDQPDPDADDYLSDDQIGRLKKEGDKVSFEEMGKLIGVRWKNIDPDRLSRFSELASQDTDRYKQELSVYNLRQEERLRSQALRYSAQESSYAATMDHGEQQMAAEQAQYTAAQQAYSAQMAGPGYSAYSGCMTYGSYSMPMYDYSACNGMAPTPNQEATTQVRFDALAAAAQHQRYLDTYSAGNNTMGYSQPVQPGNVGSIYSQTGETYAATHDPRIMGTQYPQYSAWGHQ